MKLMHAPKVKPEVKSHIRINLAHAMGTRFATNVGGAKVSQGFKRQRNVG